MSEDVPKKKRVTKAKRDIARMNAIGAAHANRDAAYKLANAEYLVAINKAWKDFNSKSLSPKA
jgi:hypothetical protein